MAKRTIKVDALARVEGEGGLSVTVKDGRVTDVKLDIFEPPRFFEALLRGRRFDEAPDITSRICGICPVAYQMSAIHAMEDACGVRVEGQLRALRRLMYCGEWIESHTLHVYMLHAPDFLGYASGIEMAKDHPAIVERGLQLKKVGNEVIALLGGRSVHPINAKVGGFYRVPTADELAALAERLRWAREAARETVHWTATLPIPDYERDYVFVALSHPEEYPFNEGRIVSNHGLDIAPREYDDHFAESQVPHSTALHSEMIGRGAYAVGPLAQDAARQAGLGLVCRNPFQSIVVRSVEILHACDEALRIITQYEPPAAPAITIRPRAGTGYGCTEAPRGLLYHRYRIDDQGAILDAKIVPPTSQNQRTIEDDLRDVVPRYLDLAKDKLTWRCEQTVRNYDPCISCATHFLRVNVTRT
jgi:coenzyme F420-reducing hydrogenase alpha subunit